MKGAYDISAEDAGPGRRNGVVRRASSRAIRPRPDRENHRNRLTPAMRRALRILRVEGPVTRDLKFWRTRKGTGIPLETIIALFDRYLVKIVTESRHRVNQVAELMEIGTLVAERLITADHVRSGEWISEEVSRLVGTLTDGFEDSPNVYPQEREAEETVE